MMPLKQGQEGPKWQKKGFRFEMKTTYSNIKVGRLVTRTESYFFKAMI